MGFRLSQGRKDVKIKICVQLHQLHTDIQTVRLKSENVIEVLMLGVCARKST